jgi:hypothetical protein
MIVTPPAIVSSGHVLLTGPVVGTVTKRDGTVIDVTPTVIEVADQAEADEVSHLLGLHYAAVGHPDDIELDDESGEMVQRPFVYQAPPEFADYTPLEG